MRDRRTLERGLADLRVREFDIGPPANAPTVGFEFDVHFGLVKAVIEDAGLTMPADKARVTDHDRVADGFDVTREGAGPEIARIAARHEAVQRQRCGKSRSR